MTKVRMISAFDFSEIGLNDGKMKSWGLGSDLLSRYAELDKRCNP